MVFGEGFDKSLLLILVGDRHNREYIAKFISDIPKELIVRIQNELRNRECGDNSKKIELNHAIRDDAGNISMFNVKIKGNSLRIKLSRWEQTFNNKIEEVYDLDLGKIDLEHIKDDDLTYVGSYYFSNSSLFMGIGPMIVDSDGVGYEVYVNEDDKFVVQVSGKHVYDRVVNLDVISDGIQLEDLVDRRSVSRLVRRRKK